MSKSPKSPKSPNCYFSPKSLSSNRLLLIWLFSSFTRFSSTFFYLSYFLILMIRKVLPFFFPCNIVLTLFPLDSSNYFQSAPFIIDDRSTLSYHCNMSAPAAQPPPAGAPPPPPPIQPPGGGGNTTPQASANTKVCFYFYSNQTNLCLFVFTLISHIYIYIYTFCCFICIERAWR